MRKIGLVVLLGGLISNPVLALKVNTEGNVKELTTYLETHSDTSARGLVDFTLDVSLSAPCTRLYFSQQESSSFSLVLASKARDQKLKFYYDTEKIAPWSSSVCEVYAIREM